MCIRDSSDGFPVSGSTIEFQLGEQKYIATLNTTLDYTVSGSNVAIGAKNYSFSEALELLVEDSTFHISGPEKDRISVGFEQNGSNFRLFAAAKDGVLSGHALVAATCLLYTSPSPRDRTRSRMPSSA